MFSHANTHTLKSNVGVLCNIVIIINNIFNLYKTLIIFLVLYSIVLKQKLGPVDHNYW